MNHYFDHKNTQFLDPEIKQHGNHVILTNVQKPPQKKLLNIDTKFQEEYNSLSHASFTFQLPEAIHDVKSISVSHMEVPYSFYSFSEQKGNTTFIVSDDTNADEYVFQIHAGHYTESTLISTIQGLITAGALNGLIQISMENHKTKLEIANGNGNTYTFHWNVGDHSCSSSETDIDYTKTRLKSRLGWCLGFREPSYTMTSVASIVSEGIIYVHTTPYVMLVVDEFSQNHPNSFVSPMSDSYVNKNVLARMQVFERSLGFGETIVGDLYSNLVSDVRVFRSKTSLQKLKIELVDEWGIPLDLNHLDFSFVLEVDYV